MRLLLIFIITLFFSSLKAQENKIDYINFEYYHSIIVGSRVEIKIGESFEQKNTYEVNVKYHEFRNQVEKTFKITSGEFSRIINQFKKIKNEDLIESFESGLDGGETSIEIGQYFSTNTIKYSIWGLHKSQSNTKFKELLKTVQMILKVAEIKIKDFN